MSWTGNSDASPTARIATVRNALLPSEEKFIQLLLDDPAAAVENTAQEIADRAGVARSTVIRACQRLGYRGYPQLRVALTRELAQTEARNVTYEEGALGRIRADVDALAAALPHITAALDSDGLDAAITRISAARRLLVVANGLSSAQASDLAMRLTAVGRPSEYVADAIGQQIAARGLAPDDACVVISGSGANESTLRSARAVRASGAHLIAVTSFAQSPLVELADNAIVVAPATGSFRHELEHTSRVSHTILLESLVGLVASDLGETADHTRALVLDVLSDNLSE